MNGWILITVLIILFIIILGVYTTFLQWKRKKDENAEDTNYQAFFVMGICFLPIGAIMMLLFHNTGFIGITVLGVIYIAIGLANHDKWEKNW